MDGYFIYKNTPHGTFVSFDRKTITCTFHLRDQLWLTDQLLFRVPQLKEFIQLEIVQPKLISPLTKLLAQAESELKHKQNERPVFTPILVRPEFDKSGNTTISTEDTKVNNEAEDEEPPSKRMKTCGYTQKGMKKKKNSKRK